MKLSKYKKRENSMTYYYGIIYFSNGTTRTTGKSNDRRQAERMTINMFETVMRTAANDFSKPTRYKIVADN